MTTVALPWTSSCFGCSHDNPHGLGLTFTRDAAGFHTDFDLGGHYSSYPGVVHGGIVALVCDETMGNLIMLDGGAVAVTTSLRMRYVGTVHVGLPHRVTAHLTSAADSLVKATADVTDARGDLVASATATYHRSAS
jgi:acyl-coenzyme A thioesterase PaaI-like protein